jgi:serine/threonine-protein kinase HipA
MIAQEAIIFIYLEDDFYPAGKLITQQEGDSIQSEFAYGRLYLERSNAIPLDPVVLPLGTQTYSANGIFGGIRDSSPDGWGRHLLSTAASEKGVTPTEFDYLTALPVHDRIGALAYGKTPKRVEQFKPSWFPQSLPGEHLDLTSMIEATDRILNNEELPAEYKRFLIRGSSIGGAQPKAPVKIDGTDWIAKFSIDKEAWSSCRIEHANMVLAQKCSINTPKTTFMTLANGRDVFFIQRFDRTEEQRHHFITAQTLVLSTNHEDGSYIDVANNMRKYIVSNRVKSDLKEFFKRMVFNALCSNRDDHLKNHGFLYSHKEKGWVLSPAYDIVPQPELAEGEAKYLQLEIGKYGKAATKENIISRCEAFALDKAQATDIFEELKNIVAENWQDCCDNAQVPKKDHALLRACYRLALS